MSDTPLEAVKLIDIPEADNYETETVGVSSVVDAVVVDGAVGATALSHPLAPLHPSAPAVSSLTPAQVAEDAQDGHIQRARGEGSEFTPNERETILDLYYNRKLTQTQIAKQLGVHQSTVSRLLGRYRDTTTLGKLRLKARTEEILDKAIDIAIEQKDVKELVRLLKGTKTPDGVRVVEPDREFVTGKGGKDGGPNIFVNMPYPFAPKK